MTTPHVQWGLVLFPRISPCTARCGCLEICSMARGWFQLGTVNPDELAGLRERYFTDDSPSGQRPITPVFFQVRPPAQGFQIAATRVRDCVTLPGVGPSPLPDPVFFRALHGPFSFRAPSFQMVGGDHSMCLCSARSSSSARSWVIRLGTSPPLLRRQQEHFLQPSVTLSRGPLLVWYSFQAPRCCHGFG